MAYGEEVPNHPGEEYPMASLWLTLILYPLGLVLLIALMIWYDAWEERRRR